MSFDKNKLIEQIKRGRLKIKPKWMFLLRAIAIFLMLITSTLFMVFVFGTIIFFIFYQNNFIGLREMITMGMLIRILPWALIFAAIAFLVLFEVSLSKIMPLYRKPILMVTAFLIVGVICVSFMINRMILFRQAFADHPKKPGMARWLIKEHQQRLDQYFKEGTVKSPNENGEITVQMDNGEIISVGKNNFGMMPRGENNPLKEGMEVVISGIEGEYGFEVFRIRPKNRPRELRPEINCTNGCNNIWTGRETKPRINKNY